MRDTMPTELEELEKQIDRAEKLLLRKKKEYEAAIEKMRELLEEKARLTKGLDGGRVSLQEWNYTWQGQAVWYDGDGTVDCDYRAEMTFRSGSAGTKGPEVRKLEMENPGFREEDAVEALQKSLRTKLDDEFEDYCSDDDYYQPVVEDFEAEYYAREWAEERDLELIRFEGSGSDGGYKPKLRKW